jgi:hypothetical protein
MLSRVLQRDMFVFILPRAHQCDCIDKSTCQSSPAQVGKIMSWSLEMVVPLVMVRSSLSYTYVRHDRVDVYD